MKMSLGAFIAHLRKEKGLTQKQLSEILNVSDKTVSHWEREESSPDISLLPLLADTFSITVDELLRGERKSTKADNSGSDHNNAAIMAETKTEDNFHVFRQKSIIAGLISVISGFTSTLILSLLNYTFHISDPFNSAVKIINVIPIALNIIVQTICLIYAYNAYSGYIKKDVMKPTAFRFLTLTVYSAFLSLFTTIGSTDIIYSWSDYVFLIVCTSISAIILLAAELLLRKKGILPKDPKWPEARRNRLKLKLACTALAFILLWGTLIANQEYHPYTTIYKHAEYVEFPDRKTFDEYISTDVTAPKEKYEDKYQSPYDIEFYEETENGTELCNTFYRNEEGLEYMMIFNYGNKEVLKIRTTDGNGFPIRCYTHSALIEAEKKAEPEIKAVKICLFALYPVSIAVAFCVYFAIKKKKEL